MMLEVLPDGGGDKAADPAGEVDVFGEPVVAPEPAGELARIEQPLDYCPVKQIIQGSTPMVTLMTFDDKQFLHNRWSGETIVVTTDDGLGKWRLHSADGFAYLHREGSEPVWTNTLLKQTVWRLGGRLIIKDIDSHGNEVIQYLDEVQKKLKTTFASWPHNGYYHQCPVVDVVQFEAPRNN